MSNSVFVKAAQNFWHALIHDTQKEIYDDLSPLIKFVLDNGGPVILAVATGVLQGNPPTAIWIDLINQFIPLAEAQGKKFAANEASILLNLAKARLGVPA